MRRRTVLKGATGATIIGIAGCAGVTGPDPRVVDAEAEAGFLDAIAGQAEIQVTVVNRGSSGRVQVYVEIYDSSDTMLGRYGEEVYMEEDERRRVDIRVEAGGDAEYFEAHAESA